MKHVILKCTKTENVIRLLPQILMDKEVDVVDLYSPESDGLLSEYCQGLAEHYNKVKAYIYEDGTEIHGKQFIANEEDYYIFINENIVFLETSTLGMLFQKKKDNPQYFIISPLVVNNWLSCYIMQRNEKYPFGGQIKYSYTEAFNNNDFIITNGNEAELVHRTFLAAYEKDKRLKNAHCDDFECCTRFPIDCICWYGADMAKLLDEYDIFNAEPFFTYQYPMANDMKNLIMGSKIVANYAYEPQREYLDSTDIMDCYQKIMLQKSEKNKGLASMMKWCSGALSKQKYEKDITIYTLVGPKEEYEVKDMSRTPVQLNAVKVKDCKYELRDDDGTDISDMYPYYGMLTGIYWLMKHIPKGTDYIAIETPRERWDMTKEQMSGALDKFKVILPNKITKSNIANIYCSYHSTVDFTALANIIKVYFTDYAETWDAIMYNEDQMGFVKNAVITDRETFIDMWSFIFNVLDKFRSLFGMKTKKEIEEHAMAFSSRNAPTEYNGDWLKYQSRMFEFMAERLVTLYIYKHFTEIGTGAFEIE